MDALFSLSNLLVLPFWLLMIFLPLWQWTRRIIGSIWIVAPAALLYVILLLPNIGGVTGELLNPSLAGVQTFLATPEGATIGWVHFLAFDLFVGRWVYLDSQKIGLTPWITSPILFFVLMMGPLGLIVYLGAKVIFKEVGKR